MISTSHNDANKPSSKLPRKTKPFFSRFLKSKSAATSIEYALIIASITVAVIVSVSVLGGSTNNAFKKVGGGLDGISEPGTQTGGNTGGGSGGDSGGNSIGGSGSGSGGGSGSGYDGDSGSDFGGSSGSGSDRGSNSGPDGGSGSGSEGGGGSDGGFGSDTEGGSGDGSGGGSGSGAGESYGSASSGGPGGGSDGGTDDDTGSGSTAEKSGKGSMYATSESINDNQGYGNSNRGLSSDTSGYDPGNSLIGKEENSAGSVDGRNKSGDSDKKSTERRSYHKFWLFPLILVLGTLLFYMSQKNNKSADNSRNKKTIDLTPKN